MMCFIACGLESMGSLGCLPSAGSGEFTSDTIGPEEDPQSSDKLMISVSYLRVKMPDTQCATQQRVCF